MTIEHRVRQGECVASIAARYGVSAEELWEHPDNAALREARADPRLLSFGDVICVPDERRRSTIEPGGTHRFTANVPDVEVALRLVDDDGEPLAGASYRLECGGDTRSGQADDDGVVTEAVPARLHRVRLVLDPDSERERSMTVLLGHLDPADTPSGVAQRLANMGFHDPSSEEQADSMFGQHEQLESPDEDSLRERLVERHGS